jgi:cytochrome oxidase assembly protein ShyY1
VFNSGEQAVLVNLGWVVGSINRQEIPDVQAITGKYQLSGHVRNIEQGIMLMEQVLVKGEWPLRVQQIELDKFSTLISRQLLPFVVYLDKTESVGYEKNWQPIVMPPEKHRAYAFQWFSLAIAWLLLMIWASIKLGKNSEQALNH